MNFFFTVTDGNEAGDDVVLIQPFLFYCINEVVLMLTGILSTISIKKDRGLNQNKVNLSLTFTQTLG